VPGGVVILGLIMGSWPVNAAPQDPSPTPPVLRPDQVRPAIQAPRVRAPVQKPAASVMRGSHVSGTLSFVYSWGGPGAATLWTSPAQADFLGTRDSCGEGPVSATAPVR
jgi:hypothetical protein